MSRSPTASSGTTPSPGMTLNPPPDPPAPAVGVTVSPCAESDLDEYLEVCAESGLPPDLAQRIFSPSFAADPDVQLFIGRLDGRPVGTTVAIRSGDVSGVYAVGTLPACPTPGRRHRTDMGRGDGRPSLGLRHHRASGVRNGLPGVRRDGLPDGGLLRDVLASRTGREKRLIPCARAIWENQRGQFSDHGTNRARPQQPWAEYCWLAAFETRPGADRV